MNVASFSTNILMLAFTKSFKDQLLKTTTDMRFSKV